MADRIRKAIVVGASSGIGRAIVARLVKGGATVVAVARREDELKRLATELEGGGGNGTVLPLPHDVTEYDAVPLLFRKACEELDGLDAIFYAAGIMPSIEPDEYTFEKDRSVIEVNVLGAFAWLNEAAQRFSHLGEGKIIGISSIAGDRGRRGNPAYCTSKAALNTYLESLRNRLEVKGVGVTTIKPGFVDTVMTKGKPGLIWLISPETAANSIVEAAESGSHTVYVPGRWRIIGTIVRLLPSFIFKRLNI